MQQCCDNSVRPAPRVCSHLAPFKQAVGGAQAFHDVLKFFTGLELGLRRVEARAPRCDYCGNSVVDSSCRLHACLQCVFVGCFAPGHIQTHCEASGHNFAVCISALQLYCASCKDYVYDQEFDLAVKSERAAAISDRLAVEAPDTKRARFVPWTPVARDTVCLKQFAEKMATPPHLLGLRGLLNLGSSCFLNSILQCFVHNPVLRNYFLSDQHNQRLCQVRANREASGSGPGCCLGCEMDHLFSEIFSGSRQPFSPHKFLFAIWQHSEYFAGYEQQDAHELFISALNGIHQHIGSNSGQCSCVVHRTFGSTLRSDVTCMACQNVSSSFDPCLDISLEIPHGEHTSLEECLMNFTRPEFLGADNKLKCARCGNYEQARKQMSLQRPAVALCFQIKRFQRTMGSRKMVSSKIETGVSFPFELNMAPYLSSEVRKKNAAAAAATVAESHDLPPFMQWPPPNLLLNAEETEDRGRMSFIYDLFAVVNHQGTLDNGHYTSYVLQQLPGAATRSGEWVKCDDEKLTRATHAQVASSQSQVYLLFYCKRYVEYE